MSKKTDIALLALQELSAHGRSMPGRELAQACDVSTAYLSQAMGPLIEAGWVVSRSGPDGGYALAPRLRKLSVLQVVEAVEGPIDQGGCVMLKRDCDAEHPCQLHHIWAQARAGMWARLARVSAI